MADVVFGADYNLIGNPKFRYVCDTIDKSNVRMSALIQAPQFAALKIDKHMFRDAIRARNRFVKFVSRVVKERMDKCTTSTDLFANLAIAKDPETGSSFRPEEIGAESTTLIVAGSDTSSTTIAASLFYLAHNPSAYARTAEEVRGKFNSSDDITMGPTLASCVYLRACIDESMRMSPAVGSSLWREVVTDGAVIDGEGIPAGADVGVPIYSIHHNPKYYPEPFTFRPERWLVGEAGHTRADVDRAHASFTPFSIGMRGCLGKGLAITETMLTLATILFRCDFKLADGELGRVGEGKAGAAYGRHRQQEYQLHDHVTSQKDGPFLQFAPRW
ncbi:MAG: hypothetical protein M1815_005439 [Lichina confinis]|nr:MAG: hypothetical protein M1815_005439 [Lichina confinis]